MTETEHLLAIVAEECGEVAQRAMKCLRFGINHTQETDAEYPLKYESNDKRLVHEFNDLVAVMEMLSEMGAIDHVYDLALINKKKSRVKKYTEVSRNLGIIS